MKVAIIGAGASGLVTAKYALEKNFECDVFEQTGCIGGTWVYTDRVDTDENGLPVHSSMYAGMRTNLPKELMTFLDFPFPQIDETFLTPAEVIDYFDRFAKKFNVYSHIKYYHAVMKIEPRDGNKWFLTIENVKTKTKELKEYDAVFICNGHFQQPIIPTIPGQDIFKGPQSHSHSYRNTHPFEHKRVLIVGAATSGQDIGLLISEVAEHVFLSNRREIMKIKLTKNMTETTVVKELEENAVIFENGAKEPIDAILYCTGYNYAFPFLTDECGIQVDHKCIRYLYKHIINTEHPTMYFIGIPFSCTVMPTFDIQARFALAALAGDFTSPTKEKMMKELEVFFKQRRDAGVDLKYTHGIGGPEGQKIYFDELAATARIRRIPPVISSLYASLRGKERDLESRFEIIDDEHFIKIR